MGCPSLGVWDMDNTKQCAVQLPGSRKPILGLIIFLINIVILLLDPRLQQN